MKFNGLISEDGEYVSSGRIALWITLGISIYFWIRQITVPATLYDAFVATLIYNFGKKGINSVDTYLQSKVK